MPVDKRWSQTEITSALDGIRDAVSKAEVGFFTALGVELMEGEGGIEALRASASELRKIEEILVGIRARVQRYYNQAIAAANRSGR